MTNPTPTPTTTPAVTARSARETIKAHVEACERWAGGPEGLQHEATAPTSGYISAMMRTALPLRALLDAPEGGVGRVIEAAESMVSAEEQYCVGTETTLEGAVLVHAGNAKRVYQAAIALRAALAALRASPESVGGAPESVADCARWGRHPLTQAQSNELGNALSERNRVTKERDTLRAALEAAQRDLEKARGEVERVTAVLVQTAKDRDAAHKARCEANDIARANADERNRAVGELMRLRADRDRAAMPTTANASAPPPPAPQPASEAPKFTDGSTGLRLTEAPISERARLVYEGAVRFAVRDPRDTPEVCARIAASVLAASERAAKAPAPAEG